MLVTGANGFLGSAILREWTMRGRGPQCAKGVPRARGLLHNRERGAGLDGVAADFVHGDVLDLPSLCRAFEGEDTVVHTAGVVTLGDRSRAHTYRTNVVGTSNVVTACRMAGVRRLVYVSSVHAFPEIAHGVVRRESRRFDPALVEGDYAKTKAEATTLVLAIDDVEVVVVHPSGIVGPNDYTGGNMTQLIRDALTGRLPATVPGGYDFVDVRDVASGCLAAASAGRPGQNYLLTGSYHRISEVVTDALAVVGRRWRRPELPMGLGRAVAPVMQTVSALRQVPPTFTAASLQILSSNGVFDHGKASCELGYVVRPWEETVRDWVGWITERAPAELALHPV